MTGTDLKDTIVIHNQNISWYKVPSEGFSHYVGGFVQDYGICYASVVEIPQFHTQQLIG